MYIRTPRKCNYCGHFHEENYVCGEKKAYICKMILQNTKSF